MTDIANAWCMVVLEKEMYLEVVEKLKIQSKRQLIYLHSFAPQYCHYEKHTLFAYTFAPNTETALMSSYLIVFVFSLKLSHM